MAETPKSSDIPKRTGSWWSKNWFYTVLIAVAVIGGLSAFGLPLIVSQPFSAGDSISTLRQAILAATGGVLAILTLWENRRKNIQEKEKNDQDHTHQVHAERRSRYAKAIEQLADEKAPICLGGVYTLVKLVDEWLADEKTVPDIEERHKEGQVIINNLCAYIRSPFLLAERAEQLDKPYAKDLQKDFKGDKEKFDADKRAFAQDKAALEEERQVRQSIIKAIRERLQDFGAPGPWSNFDYDFSNTLFFYPIDFSNTYFCASLNFLGATFTGYASFSGATFTQNAEFRLATFTRRTDFSGATFTQVIFSGATFAWTDFYGATFTQAFFIGVTFTRADFTRVSFTHADFHRAAFTHDADFTMAAFTHADFRRVTFTHDADFSSATFTGEASFIMATFTGYANFSGATFTQRADFSSATFTGEASFLQGADFRRVTFHSEPSFIGVLGKARFSYKVIPEDYNFEVSPGSPYKIETEEKEYDGVKFIIPKGTILFDPDEPSE